MKLLVVGPLCAGKTTIAAYLRPAVTVVDLDEEFTRVNGGVYPDIETRKSVIAPRALARVAAMAEVIVLHSTLDPGDVRGLRAAGFTTALLEVSDAELRRRHRLRLAEEGWTNEAWFEANHALIEDLRQQRLFDHVVDAQRAPAVVAAELLGLGAG